MSGIDLPSFIETYGLPGFIIMGLCIAVRSLWSQNQELQKEMRDTLREVFPAMTALQAALDFIQRNGGK